MGTHLAEYVFGWMPWAVKTGLQILLAAKRRENSFTERKLMPGKMEAPLCPFHPFHSGPREHSIVTTLHLNFF